MALHATEQREALIMLLDILGESGVKEFSCQKLTVNQQFYVFHDVGRGESSIFQSLSAVCKHFFRFYIEIEEGESWDSMSEVELVEWYGMLEQWHAEGASELIPNKYFGWYYSARDGFGHAEIEV